MEKDKFGIVGMLQETITSLLAKSDSFRDLMRKMDNLDTWVYIFFA
jgi:hypothetical protein